MKYFDLKSDWFCGAYEQKSVDSGLKLVESTTRQRLVFVESLRKSLKGSSSGEDSISELIAKTEKFQKTLELRLPLLDYKRKDSWLREYTNNMSQAFFSTEISSHPVFLSFKLENSKALLRQIYLAWDNKKSHLASLFNVGDCLLLDLLRLNETWHHIDSFSELFPSLKLSQYDGKVNSFVDSKALDAYLLNVRKHLLMARKDIDSSFEYFMDHAHPFLKHQIKLSREFEESRSKFYKHNDDFSKGSTPYEKAMKFMGFTRQPQKEELKKAYRLLAKKYHPDCPGGSAEMFKLLSESFQQIAAKI